MLIILATDSHANIHNNTFNAKATATINIAITVPNLMYIEFPDLLKICKWRNLMVFNELIVDKLYSPGCLTKTCLNAVVWLFCNPGSLIIKVM